MQATRAREAGTSGSRSRLARTTISLLAVLWLGGLIWFALDRAIESVVAPAVPEDALSPVFRFVKGGENGSGASRTEAMVWLTSTALEDCAQVRDGRSRDVKRRLEGLLSSVHSSRRPEDEEACAPFQLGKVAAGTRVEILGECGQMAKVRISSGSLRGQQGCIETDRLEERPAPFEPAPAARQESR